MWLVTLLNCIGIPMIFGAYGIAIEGYASILHPEKKGTFDPFRMVIYSILLGVGWGLVLH